MRRSRSESKYFHTAQRMDEALLSLLLEKDFAYITVKDICARAGVNRSTFYLHYENTADLLEEAVVMIQDRFQKSIPDQGMADDGIAAAPREDLFFMTDRWLLPWLDSVRENQHVYRAIHAQAEVFGVERAYRTLFQNIFSPVLSRYGVAAEKHEYIMEFYRRGLAAVLLKWASSGCRESTAEIAEIIQLCLGCGSDGKTD